MPCPLGRVNRQFKAERPDRLWVLDFTYVSTWQGWLYVAFIVDVFARRHPGAVSTSTRTDFALDALEQALHAHNPDRNGLIHHSTDLMAEADCARMGFNSARLIFLCTKQSH